MTRTKGWLQLTGLGEAAKICCKEIEKAISMYPNLEFIYPSDTDIRIMKREMKDKAIRRSNKTNAR